jgi:predicted transcriptional regulator
LLQKVELAIEQANRGEVVDHDEFMAELEQNHEV